MAILASPQLPLGYNLRTLKHFENLHFKLSPMHLCNQAVLETYTWVLILFLNCVCLLATVGDSNPNINIHVVESKARTWFNKAVL